MTYGMTAEHKAAIREKIYLVREWFEGHPDSAVIEELASQWVTSERRVQELEAQLALSAQNTTNAYKEITLLKHREKIALRALENEIKEVIGGGGNIARYIRINLRLEQAEKEMG